MSKIIDEAIQAYVDNNEISGGAMIIRRKDEIIYQSKWGFSDINSKIPVDDGSIFRMMSMTKPVTAVGVLKLIEKGPVSLDDTNTSRG